MAGNHIKMGKRKKKDRSGSNCLQFSFSLCSSIPALERELLLLEMELHIEEPNETMTKFE